MYLRYNTGLRDRSIKRRQNIDPVLLDEIDLDGEWIAEKEVPLLPHDTSCLEDKDLFNVDAVRNVSFKPCESGEEVCTHIVNILLQAKENRMTFQVWKKFETPLN